MVKLYDLDTPALLVDLDLLEQNLVDMASAVLSGGKRLRPHTKTHKTLEIAQRQLAAGATGLTVAKLGEAEVYAERGIDDLFIANQIIGAQKVARLIDLAGRVRVRVGVDSQECAAPIAQAASEAGLTIALMMEVDTGLGRAGVRTSQEAVELALFIDKTVGIELVGVFTHEGHIYKATDQGAGARDAESRIGAVVDAIRAAGVSLQEISMGSTPGAKHLANEPLPTELRPGVYVFYDRSQIQFGVPVEHCALSVLATVTSIRSDGRMILDAGTKSLASDSPFPDKTTGQIIGHPELTMVGFSEEHAHVQIDSPTMLQVGDKVRIIPNHACTCVNMHEEMIAVRGEEIEAHWAIIGRGKIR